MGRHIFRCIDAHGSKLKNIKITVTDISEGMVNDARRNIGNGMFDYGVADCMNLPFDDNSFETQNYTEILDSKSQALGKYIDAHISTYLRNVYLKIKTNVKEPLENYLSLLNHKAIEMSEKIALIKQ